MVEVPGITPLCLCVLKPMPAVVANSAAVAFPVTDNVAPSVVAPFMFAVPSTLIFPVNDVFGVSTDTEPDAANDAVLQFTLHEASGAFRVIVPYKWCYR